MSKRSYIDGDFDDEDDGVTGVEPITGEPFRYHVASRSSAAKYLVDLSAYRWNGFCGCRDFETRRQPKLARGEKPKRSLRCWHIERARDYFFANVAPKLAAALEKQMRAANQPVAETKTKTKTKNEDERKNGSRIYFLKPAAQSRFRNDAR